MKSKISPRLKYPQQTAWSKLIWVLPAGALLKNKTTGELYQVKQVIKPPVKGTPPTVLIASPPTDHGNS